MKLKSDILVPAFLMLAALFGVAGTIWRFYTVEKPIREINESLTKISRGDLAVKLA